MARNGLLFMYGGEITEIAFPRYSEVIVRGWHSDPALSGDEMVEMQYFDDIRIASLKAEAKINRAFDRELLRRDPEIANLLPSKRLIERRVIIVNCVFDPVVYRGESLPVLDADHTVLFSIINTRFTG